MTLRIQTPPHQLLVETSHPPGHRILAKIRTYLRVSKNNGIPKSSILIGFSMIFTIHFGGFPPIFGEHPSGSLGRSRFGLRGLKSPVSLVAFGAIEQARYRNFIVDVFFFFFSLWKWGVPYVEVQLGCDIGLVVRTPWLAISTAICSQIARRPNAKKAVILGELRS